MVRGPSRPSFPAGYTLPPDLLSSKVTLHPSAMLPEEIASREERFEEAAFIYLFMFSFAVTFNSTTKRRAACILLCVLSSCSTSFRKTRVHLSSENNDSRNNVFYPPRGNIEMLKEKVSTLRTSSSRPSETQQISRR